jgi:hypothetical protein
MKAEAFARRSSETCCCEAGVIRSRGGGRGWTAAVLFVGSELLTTILVAVVLRWLRIPLLVTAKQRSGAGNDGAVGAVKIAVQGGALR